MLTSIPLTEASALKLEELAVHRTNITDQALELLLNPLRTPALERICIDYCEQLQQPNLQNVPRLEGVWVNYSEHGMPTSFLCQDARQALAPVRRQVHLRYQDSDAPALASTPGESAAFGILLQ
eukprot:TRINITY_DN21493_c0_g2_i1.p1 TRINITY_DN21493_c0_g2~~TRINITY_DN21493_c0_g2_i1.p1  ORF type:complete len:124 (-),score=14.79 TRINITY_DN21493_c0_g2_i1:205-576(-)